MDRTDISRLLAGGEGTTVEFWHSPQDDLDDALESYCAFLNRDGGELLLGVGDDGTVIGLPPKAIPDMVRNLISSMNDANLLHPPFCVLPEVLDVEDRKIIRLHVPRSSDVHLFRGVCYDRINDADIKVTTSDQMAQMYIRKRNIYTEQTSFPEVGLEDLRLDLLPRVRQLACAFRPDHPWKELDTLELLRSARLNAFDTARNDYAFNAAAVLLLGKDETIRRLFPAYRTDALLQRVNLERYDDRAIVATNLIESYDQLIAFAQKWLPDKFYLEQGTTVSLRDRILRETVVNLLIHREYTSARPGRLIIRREALIADNPNKALQTGHITLQNLCPRPKNPIIADFFQAIGRADELGSGVRNLFRCVRLYSGAEPVFDENDIFTLTIPLDDSHSPDMPDHSPKRGAAARRLQDDKQLLDAITETIRLNPRSSAKSIADRLGDISPAQVRARLTQLRQHGLLRREGAPGNGGRWILLPHP